MALCLGAGRGVDRDVEEELDGHQQKGLILHVPHHQRAQRPAPVPLLRHWTRSSGRGSEPGPPQRARADGRDSGRSFARIPHNATAGRLGQPTPRAPSRPQRPAESLVQPARVGRGAPQGRARLSSACLKTPGLTGFVPSRLSLGGVRRRPYPLEPVAQAPGAVTWVEVECGSLSHVGCLVSTPSKRTGF